MWHQAKKKADQVDSVVGENSGCMATGITITSGCVGADITAVLADGDDPPGSDNLDNNRYMAKKEADIIGLVKNNFPVQETSTIELETRKSENISVVNANLSSNLDCYSTKQVQGQVQDKGDGAQSVAQGDGQGGPKTMGGSNTQLGTR